MPDVKTTMELKELYHGFTLEKFAVIILSSRIFNEIYREHFSDADQHTLKQMYLNIKTIGAEEKTCKVIEQLLNEQHEHPI